MYSPTADYVEKIACKMAKSNQCPRGSRVGPTIFKVQAVPCVWKGAPGWAVLSHPRRSVLAKLTQIARPWSSGLLRAVSEGWGPWAVCGVRLWVGVPVPLPVPIPSRAPFPCSSLLFLVCSLLLPAHFATAALVMPHALCLPCRHLLGAATVLNYTFLPCCLLPHKRASSCLLCNSHSPPVTLAREGWLVTVSSVAVARVARGWGAVGPSCVHGGVQT